MNVLVTGATGFLGTALCRCLEVAGHLVTRLSSRDADLRLAGSLDRFNDRQFDQIYHLAAWTQAGDFCLRHPGEQWLINQAINTNVLTWAYFNQRQAKIVAIGTSCSYDPVLPMYEENYLQGRPIEGLFTYAMTKRMLYTGLLALQQQFGIRYLHLVPSTLYGPGYLTDGRQMHFIFDLMRKIIRAKFKGDKVQLWGDGLQRRELIFVDDFVRLALCLNARCENDTFNIGSGQEFTIRQFAEAICEIVDYDPSLIEYDTTKYVGARSKCLRVEKIQGLLGDLELTPLQTGLRETVAWFLKHRDALDPKVDRN